MNIIKLQQGSDEWKAHRANALNASEAPAMLGVSPHTSRSELLRMKFTGTDLEISPQLQRVFDEGHRVEAATRPIAEEIVGEELFSATATDEGFDEATLSASFDGITMDESTIWECKQANQAKMAEVEAGRCPECDYPQVQQQLLISGAERCLYSVGDGTKEGTRTTWVLPDDHYQKRLLAGWVQFQEDLANYEPPADAPEAIGQKMSALPSLDVRVEGKVLATNLDQFKSRALEVFDAISTELSTDQDFADAEETVKWCKDVESKLESAKEHALAQTASIDDLFKAIDEIKETARQKRLSLDKLVKSRKEQVRAEIRSEAESALDKHVSGLNERLDGRFIDYRADFAGAMKNKRTIQSLRDAVEQVLSDAKIETSAQADAVQANLKTLDELVGDDRRLFPDLQQIATKPADDFEAVVKLRIAEDEKAQAERAERERKKAEDEQEIAERRQAEENEPKQLKPGQVEAQSVAQPEPTKVESPTPEASKEVRVNATFSDQVKASADPEDVANALLAKLRAAGFNSVIGVEVDEGVAA